MKFMHLSDLHLGKRLNEFSLIDDQEYILKEIINIADEQKLGGVIIAGDVYDKSIPSAEAVKLFDDFLFSLSKRDLKVFVISGNHDSAERIAFGGRIMNKGGVYMAPVYDGNVQPVTLEDEHGKINVYMLPFIKPANVRSFFEKEEIASYTDALRLVISQMNINKDERNILVTHQFVTGSERSESEEISVGGSDNVDASVFEGFDYVALGHIHKAQSCGNDNIRYCGSPLKYSFSEAKNEKSVTIITMNAKGDISCDFAPLTALRDMVELKGTYDELMNKSFYENTSYREDYVRITLTDENDIPDGISKLRTVYKNIMRLDYDNAKTRHTAHISGACDVNSKSPAEHFSDFYKAQNGLELTGEQSDFIQKLIEKIWGEEK